MNIEKLLESNEAKLDRAYDLARKVVNENPSFRALDSTEVPRYCALITELDRGLASFGERVFYKFEDRYLTGLKKYKGQGILSNKPYGAIKIIIQLPNKRHVSRTDYNWGPKPTLECMDPTLWSKCLENREKVIYAVAKKYNLKNLWNDDSGFDYLLGQIIGGYDYLKGKKFVDLDEKEIIKRTENFIRALREWAYNDPTA